MDRKISAIGIMLLIITITVVEGVLFLFPYEPKNPPKADDSGSTQEGIQNVVNANNQFAFDLYSELSKTERGNIFFSPYSIFSAIAMTYEGARGQTADEIKSVFHFPEISILRSNFAAIYNSINRKTDAYELKTGNALWVQQDYPLLESYISIVEQYYGGKAVNLDFIKETEESRQTINSFIEEQTNGKIKDLIPPGYLDSMTRLILTNAIYFKGTWTWEFDKSETREEDFKITPTQVVKVPMMYMKPDEAVFNYADLGELQILELPYKGEEISMLILLPTENLDAIESSLTAEKLNEWRSKMQETKLDEIYLPKFKIDAKYFLKNALSAMGMPTIFSPGKADLSGMSGNRELFVGFVIHQAHIEVNEEGTEAAAATAVGVELTAITPRTVFRADHPFIFIVQQKNTGNILFLGRVVNPLN
ncbi:serpin family protein [Candidatus Bathyarchaeota archaeon]|nr:serpin family protein [Candidatus Bathyarchaeota archaeon]MBS7613060.1 serpin family protein [Candidatus Bathyarchaeota archaeon]